MTWRSLPESQKTVRAEALRRIVERNYAQAVEDAHDTGWKVEYNKFQPAEHILSTMADTDVGPILMRAIFVRAVDSIDWKLQVLQQFLSQTTATVEEVRQTAQLSGQKAKYVSDSAQKAAQVSQSGKKAVEQTVEGMKRIKGQVGAIAENIVRLSEQSQAIAEIAGTVADLAGQVNLLSVNASIEAARAGEQGKGFLVVAQEVKNLAAQAKQATVQVRSILNDVQKAISSAVMATEQGSKIAEAGFAQATEAGESIQALTDRYIAFMHEDAEALGVQKPDHEPRATHFAMLEALAGREHIQMAYASALEHQYLWHEFGDVHLILP